MLFDQNSIHCGTLAGNLLILKCNCFYTDNVFQIDLHYVNAAK